MIAVLCGVLISLSYYPMRAQYLTSQPMPVSRGWMPIYYLSLLNIPPRIFVVRLLEEAFRLPDWMGEIPSFAYWPLLGAFAGTRKHWAIWIVAILVLNISSIALVFYAWSQMRFPF